MLKMFEEIVETKLFWITLIIVVFYGYLKFFVYNYWKRKGVPHEEPIIPFGNILPLVLGKVSIGEFLNNSYEKFKKYRFHGVYMFYQRYLVINDPELIRLVLVKDFNRFSDRGTYYNEKVDPLSANLFQLPSEKWRPLRAKLSPTFTSGKLKQMFLLLKEIGDELLKTSYQTIENNNIVDIKDLIGRYTTDTISSIAFGFNCKSLDNPDNEFKRHGEYTFNSNHIKNAIGVFTPFVFDLFHIPLMRRDVINFFSKSFEDMVSYRRENNIVRNDFINLLMQLMDRGFIDDDEKKFKQSSDKITFAQAQAQAFVFFLAGYETTSSAVTYCLYELALNPDIQSKVHTEIDNVSSKSDLTYDSINNDYEYLHMALSETLRKHPSLGFLFRLCLDDYKIPDSNFTIKKGTKIIIPVSSLQRDPNIFPDPDKFDPTRFTKENIATRSPYVYLPFGDGPRNCIGLRFAFLQTKVALVMLLSNFKFSICDESPFPIKYSKRALIQTPEGCVYLRMEKKTNNK